MTHEIRTPADLDVMADVQTNIIGNCLCVLGDSMAMPVGSMIEKFRDEFEEHIERRRQEFAKQDYGLSAQELGGVTPAPGQDDHFDLGPGVEGVCWRGVRR